MTADGGVVEILLRRHGQTYAEEIGIRLANTPAPLFQWLVAAHLYSTRISADLARRGVQALLKAGWTTPRAMLDSTWEERVRVLNRAGYARYDESTATRLEQNCSLLLDRWSGDLRRLREEADHDVARERLLLKRFKGIGEVGADIFLREVQALWPEVFPLADRKALEAAGRLGLPTTAEGLAGMVDRNDFPRLVAALVRTHQHRDYDEITRAA